MSTMSKVMLGARVLWDAEQHRLDDNPNWFNSFPAEAVEELHWFFELFAIKTHLFEGYEKKDFSLATIVDEEFGDVPSVDVDGDDHSICMWERS
jgi:hypothetical protein